MPEFRIGTAAWTLPKEHKDQFPPSGSHLERYSQVLNAVEINTSFYRQHKHATYEKWASAVPDDFKFSVKLERLFTHERKLADPGPELLERIEGIQGLGAKLGCLLVQLPPKLEFIEVTAGSFFETLREIFLGPIAVEARNKSWSSSEAFKLRREFELSPVIADPEPYDGANLISSTHGSSRVVHYYRLHGSPEIYKSRYETARLESFAEQMRVSAKQASSVWCVFDNTTFGHATQNALELQQRL